MHSDVKFHFSLRTLFLATAIIGLNAAEFITRNWFLLIMTVIGTSVLVSAELLLSHGFSSQSAAEFGFYFCECQCALWGSLGASFLYLFAWNGGAMFGIGGPDPIVLGIIAAIEGLPISFVVYRVSLSIGNLVSKHR